MSNLSLRHIYKVYSNGCKAVSDFNMEIGNKEFIVFVGPSGCGKSTTLRMIAGLEEISAGELYIDDVLVNDMEPKDRDISMVFQNYALYPHMTVYDNMAFGLKLRHVPQEEIHQKVLWAANVLKLTDYLDVKPRAMSGGQRQRVALGRAIVRNPKVFLLDEPLSNLDAKLRTEMRAEITKLHQTLGTTFIYVTHDQVEAMTLGTRVVVMKLGVVQQIDTPQNLYEYPDNKFVAGFIGTPQMNFFEAKLLRKGNSVNVDFEGCKANFVVPFNDLVKVQPSYLKGEKVVTVGLRCENISIDPEVVAKSKNVAKVKISHFEELGSETLIYGDLNMSGDGFEDTNTRIVIKSFVKTSLKPGDVIDAAFDMNKAHFFDKETEWSVAPRLPKENVFDCDISKGTISFDGIKITLPPAIKVKDAKECELFVPTDAIYLDGKQEVKVVNVEKINDQQLIHVKLKDRVFFILSNKKVKAGETIKIGFDIKRICVKKGNEELISSLQNYNTFIGAYTNAENDKKAVKSIEGYYKNISDTEVSKLEHEKTLEIGKLGFSKILLEEYKKEFNEKKNAAQAELQIQLANPDLIKRRKDKAKAKCKEDIAIAKAQYLEQVKKLKETADANMNSEEVQKKVALINDSYEAKELEFKKLFNERFTEFENGMEKNSKYLASCTSEDQTKFNNEIQKIDAEYNAKLLKFKNIIASSQNKEEINKVKAELATIKEKYLEEKNTLITNSKTFFINVNGFYLKSTPEITKKIVQALGVEIFNANYRFELGVNSMRIANNGFAAIVKKILDYGEEKFAVCESHEDRIVVKISQNLKVGDKVEIAFDLSDLHIYENKLDIRLM